jgi:hypothetical protein
MPLSRSRSAAAPSSPMPEGLRGIAAPSDLAGSHIVGAHQLDNVDRRREPIDGVLAREDAAMPDALRIRLRRAVVAAARPLALKFGKLRLRRQAS